MSMDRVEASRSLRSAAPTVPAGGRARKATAPRRELVERKARVDQASFQARFEVPGRVTIENTGNAKTRETQ